MGGAVSINPEFQKQSTLSIFDLLSDKKRTERMFEEIACYGQQGEGMRGKKDKIDLAELLLFITKEVNLEFTDAFVKNTTVIKQAFNFSMRGSKSKKEDMSLKQFKKLMPALLLFSHLWHIFETADDNVSDGRIFRPEFIRAKQHILEGKIVGVTMVDISDDDWSKEFDAINTSRIVKTKGGKKQQCGDDYISFHEFVAYTLKNIIKPTMYVTSIGSTEDGSADARADGEGDEDGGQDDELDGGASAQNKGRNAFVRMMSGLIDDMEENDAEEARLEEEREVEVVVQGVISEGGGDEQEQEEEGGEQGGGGGGET